MATIDIIIPAYKAQNTIAKTLASIAQQTIADECVITICNDADGIGYKDFVKTFSHLIKVREIILPQNGGPGVARQFGINHTNCPFIIFMDADDTLESAYSLEFLLGEMLKKDNANTSYCGGNFVESIIRNGEAMFVLHKQDTIWMFAKIYRRSFLEKYNISFNETRANEDNGFNTLIKLCAEPEEEPIFLNTVVYCWHFNENSITRINNFDYNYNANITGYTENMMDAIYRANATKGATENILLKIVEVMVNLYVSYVETIAKDPKYSEQNLNCCKEFYNIFFAQVEAGVNETIIAENIQHFLDGKLASFKGFIPEYTFTQFMKLITGE